MPSRMSCDSSVGGLDLVERRRAGEGRAYLVEIGGDQGLCSCVSLFPPSLSLYVSLGMESGTHHCLSMVQAHSAGQATLRQEPQMRDGELVELGQSVSGQLFNAGWIFPHTSFGTNCMADLDIRQ